MRVYYFVDHTSTWFSNTGVQRVTRYLARALQEQLVEVVPVCWDFDKKVLKQPTLEQLKHLSHFGGPVVDLVDPLAGVTLSLAGLAEQWLFIPEVTTLTPHPEPPTTSIIEFARVHGMKVAALFYDAIPLKNQEYEAARPTHEAYMRALSESDLIIPISHSSAIDLTDFYNKCGIKKIPVISAQLLPAEEMGKARATLPPPVIDDGIRILCVGSIEPRKNHLGLLQSFISFRKKNPKVKVYLDIFGHIRADLEERVKSLVKSDPCIHFHGYETDEVIQSWYQKCHFSVFPSTDEGYGLPIAESLWNGRPCLCANWGSMAEIGAGGGCEMTDVASASALLASLEKMILDESHRQKLTREASARPLLIWKDYAKAIREKLQEHSSESNIIASLKTVFYYVHHTIDYPGNTGIQRVTRGLARSLENNGVMPVYVKWNNQSGNFEPIDRQQMVHLSNWNGPKGPGSAFPENPEPGSWLVFPELPYYPGSFDFKVLIDRAKNFGWRTAHVFYDVIPWKMKHIYPPAAVSEHQKYMQQLRQLDAVWSISHYSRSELRRFWQEEGGMSSEEESILGALPLPGEFLESPRVTLPPEKSPERLRQIRFLSVGTVEPRKNHLSLLKAWEIFRRKNPDLDAGLKIIGGASYPDLENKVLGLMESAGNVTWVKSPGDPEVRKAYGECDVSIYPSVEEGFGLPVLESLWYAKPSICHEGSSLRELGLGGGCLMVDMHMPEAIAGAIEKISKDQVYLNKLENEAVNRDLKTWKTYGREVLADMASRESRLPPPSATQRNLPEKNILLSVCISTYNRSPWLRVGLSKVLLEFLPYIEVCEILVVDNTSTDDTPQVLSEFAKSFPIRIHRNEKNVGMLGNLAVTAKEAKGRYVWILGDDDFVADHIGDKVLKVIKDHQDIPLIYLNYAYSHSDAPRDLNELKLYQAEGICVAPHPEDQIGLIKELSTLNENFFTSIYALIFRKDHAVGAYTQDTSGKPFSTLKTCVPTTAYVLERMFQEKGYFISQPALCVSLTVSWMRYAPLYILERFPDIFDRAISQGASIEGIRMIQEKMFPNSLGLLKEVYQSDEEIREGFSMERFISRHQMLIPFKTHSREIRDIYERAWKNQRVIADLKSPSELFH